ncbi:aspartate/glutamate racemase family protein [Candidatus Poribacteria bacterium]|nr:aspartate/glutamate racemase family protein [Candidatus Poribacteria bacterium]
MHKKIGVLGGMSAESTVTYYQYITRKYTEEFGDCGYPEIVVYSVSFQRYVDWQRLGQFEKIAGDMIHAARTLELAGAEVALIATNTMHLLFDQVQAAVRIPFLHIVDATAEAIRKRNLSKVGLLGTKLTMNAPFYGERLSANGVAMLVPDSSEQEEINRVIYEELVRGLLLESSRRRFAEIIARLRTRGAEGIIMGCTEIPLLLSEKDSSLPLFDTATIHAEKALRYAISEKG